MRSITDRLPLRDTTAWGAYREARRIPHRYGYCGGELLQYSDDRKLWVWADHASAGVDAVLTGGLPAADWVWRNDIDSTDQAVTFVEFASPVAEGVTPIARGRGKLHPTRGGLMTNAADVLHDVLASIGGLSLPEARLAAFRSQCAGLPVAGSIETDEPGHVVAQAICSSIGAVCAPDMTGFARLWPAPAAVAVRTIDARHSGDGRSVSADMDRGTVVNDLTIRFGAESGQLRGSVRAEATASITRYGRNAAVRDAPWIGDPRVAALVAERVLAHIARPQWAVNVAGIRAQVRIGQWLAFDHPTLPFSGTHMVLSREYGQDSRGEVTAVGLLVPVGAAPAIRIVQVGSAYSAQQYASATPQIQGDEAVVTITDDAGLPLAGAACVLDDQITRYSDSAGVVSFPLRYATPGDHVIVATAPGREPVTYGFRV